MGVAVRAVAPLDPAPLRTGLCVTAQSFAACGSPRPSAATLPGARVPLRACCAILGPIFRMLSTTTTPNPLKIPPRGIEARSAVRLAS